MGCEKKRERPVTSREISEKRARSGSIVGRGLVVRFV